MPIGRKAIIGSAANLLRGQRGARRASGAMGRASGSLESTLNRGTARKMMSEAPKSGVGQQLQMDLRMSPAIRKRNTAGRSTGARQWWGSRSTKQKWMIGGGAAGGMMMMSGGSGSGGGRSSGAIGRPMPRSSGGRGY